MTGMKKSRVRITGVFILILFLLVLSAACAPRSLKDRSENTDQETAFQEFTWSASSDCGVCHTNATQSFTDPASIAEKHPELEKDCFSCHTDQDTIKEAHASVTLDSQKTRATLKKTEVSEAACTSCHPQEEIAEATVSCIALTDSAGTVVNPHERPISESHAKTTCASCHKIHSEEPASVVAPDLCTNCHHASVYECHTCHD